MLLRTIEFPSSMWVPVMNVKSALSMLPTSRMREIWLKALHLARHSAQEGQRGFRNSTLEILKKLEDCKQYGRGPAMCKFSPTSDSLNAALFFEHISILIMLSDP